MTNLSVRILAVGLLGISGMMRAAEDEPKEGAETFGSVSPDKKFALRIVHNKEFAGKKEIPGTGIQRMMLVTWPEKKFVSELLPEDEGGLNFEWSDLMWSPDSRWCAFHYSFPRFGHTLVFRREGETFTSVTEQGGLSAPVDGAIRNQYVSPLRWIKPGTLLLEQETVYRGGEGEGDGTRFTATYDAKTKKFRIKRVK
jgi:hypothetical protein